MPETLIPNTIKPTEKLKYVRHIHGEHKENIFDSLVSAIGCMHKEFDVGYIENAKIYDENSLTIWSIYPLQESEEGYQNRFLKSNSTNNF